MTSAPVHTLASSAHPTAATSAELDQFKRAMQDHLTPGIVIVIGSGLSCAESLPGMKAIGEHLEKADSSSIASFADWPTLIATIKSKGLEPALKEITVPDNVADFLRCQTASCIRQEEDKVIRTVLAGTHQLRFSRLLKHLPQDNRFTIITTNYDRLIELAAETGDFLVDTRSRGNHMAPFSKTDGAYAFAKSVTPIKGRVLRRVEQRVFSLYKPHGSLDWVDYNGRAFRSSFDLGPESALIITPGRDKYREGYNQPFDMHRELANQAIDNASHLLVIGYGFNDDHLETHLTARIKAGTPTVMMTYFLTPTARELLKAGASVWGIEATDDTGSGTVIHNGPAMTRYIAGENFWDVAGFATGVFGE